MSLQSQYEHDAEIPSVPRRFGESTSEHVVRMVEEGIDDDQPSVLTVGFRQSETTPGSLDVVLESIGALRENGVRVTAFDTEAMTETVGKPGDTPTDCYDAVILFTPVYAVDGVSVGDLISDQVSEQLVVDLTGTIEPASVTAHDTTCITYRVL